MAVNAAILGALARIGHAAVAAILIVEDQGLDELNDKEAEDLCKVLRRPRGTIASLRPEKRSRVSGGSDIDRLTRQVAKLATSVTAS
jgi:hypothetical protein